MDVAPSVPIFHVGLEIGFEALGGEVVVVLVLVLVVMEEAGTDSWEICTLLYVTPIESEDKDDDEGGVEDGIGFA